jgi:hypothetical protein
MTYLCPSNMPLVNLGTVGLDRLSCSKDSLQVQVRGTSKVASCTQLGVTITTNLLDAAGLGYADRIRSISMRPIQAEWENAEACFKAGFGSDAFAVSLYGGALHFSTVSENHSKPRGVQRRGEVDVDSLSSPTKAIGKVSSANPSSWDSSRALGFHDSGESTFSCLTSSDFMGSSDGERHREASHIPCCFAANPHAS